MKCSGTLDYYFFKKTLKATYINYVLHNCIPTIYVSTVRLYSIKARQAQVSLERAIIRTQYKLRNAKLRYSTVAMPLTNIPYYCATTQSSDLNKGLTCFILVCVFFEQIMLICTKYDLKFRCVMWKLIHKNRHNL